MAEENINNEVIAEDAVIDAASQEVAEELTADITVDGIEAEVAPAAVSGPVQTVGRRKEAVVRVRMVPGTGKFVLNGRTLENYFPNKVHQQLVKSPLVLVEREEQFDIQANLKGGGPSGQAGAVRLGIARSLNEIDRENNRPELKKAGYLTRDARVPERKKAGLKKARKAPQFSKR